MPRPDSQPQTLHTGQALTLPAAPGQVLRVLAGRLWLTQTGAPGDHFLSAGEHRALGRGRAVVEADGGPVHYTVGPAQAVPTPERQSAPAARSAPWAGGRRLTSP